MSVDLVFFPMKGYQMLLGPQCSSTYLLLCLTEESKSYRFLNDMRVRKWLKNVYFWVKHNSCITLYWIVGLHWYYYEMEWDWITEKWKRRVLLGPLMLNGVKKSQARCFSDLWPWRCSYSMQGTHCYSSLSVCVEQHVWLNCGIQNPLCHRCEN